MTVNIFAGCWDGMCWDRKVLFTAFSIQYSSDSTWFVSERIILQTSTKMVQQRGSSNLTMFQTIFSMPLYFKITATLISWVLGTASLCTFLRNLYGKQGFQFYTLCCWDSAFLGPLGLFPLSHVISNFQYCGVGFSPVLHPCICFLK